MSEQVTVELTRQQRDLLLEGLRYVRSSRRYEFREPSAPKDDRRETDLRAIADLIGHLDPEAAVPAPARS